MALHCTVIFFGWCVYVYLFKKTCKKEKTCYATAMMWVCMLHCQLRGLSLKAILVYIFILFPLFLAFSCLPPQPLTLSTPDVWINHIIELCKPKKSWIHCFCCIFNLFATFPSLSFAALIGCVVFLQLKQQLSSFYILIKFQTVAFSCSLTTQSQNFYIWYIWKTSTLNTVGLH